jgi:glucose-6-phosphate dehydrogenase assembly protein OpcA
VAEAVKEGSLVFVLRTLFFESRRFQKTRRQTQSAKTKDERPKTKSQSRKAKRFMQIQLEKTLDVEVVERQLFELWKQTAGDRKASDEAAVMRARVANLLVFVTSAEALEHAHQMLSELTAVHPSRVLMMLGALADEDRDIEMTVESFCQTDKRSGAKRLTCEEVTLQARGKFVAELPSAALPLLVPDLSTFLWWRNAPQAANKVFETLLRATDRLVIDSAEFEDPERDLLQTNELYSQEQFDHVGVSDLNWARLTLWRGLLADFYDVHSYQTWLEKIDSAQIDYVAPERGQTSVAPQALLIAGWLASRLGWQLVEEQQIERREETTSFNFTGKNSQPLNVKLNRVERARRKPGRLVQVKLESSEAEGRKGRASFVVARSANNLHVLSEARLGPSIHRGRVLPVRNRSAAHLLSREMEILCNDQIYQEAIAFAAELIARLSKTPH